jgi:lysophospholipase L1-like esterase
MLKNKIYIILLAIILVFIAIALWSLSHWEFNNIDSKGKNIVCFGDSITFGYGASPGEDFPSALAKMTKAPVINAGIDGDTSTEGLERIDSDVLKREALLVIIEFGRNDFLRKIPLEVTLNNVRQMTEKIQAKGAMVAIVDISAGMFLKDYRKALSRLAREKQAIFIPAVLSGIITNPSMKSDFLHPNATGYKLVAQRIYRAVSPYLEKNAILKKLKKKSELPPESPPFPKITPKSSPLL